MQKDYWKPSVATDIVVFTIESGALKVLLIRRGQPPFKGAWALPGGFLQEGESIDSCARRELAEETGLEGLYLEQLYTFGEPKRDPRSRVLSVAYMALIRAGTRMAVAGDDAEAAAWHEMANLPKLAFDHATIIATALDRLRSKINYSSLALQLLAQHFTFAELQSTYEIIKGEAMDKRNFRKWIMGTGIVDETGNQRSEGAHRPAALYRARKADGVEFFG